MDFRRANDIIDRLAEVLASGRYIGGSYIALEWIGAESREEIMRALYLGLAARYQADFPLSRQDKEFDDFVGVIDGGLAQMSAKVFPMRDLANVDAAEQSSQAFWNAVRPLISGSTQEFLRWESAGTFAAWLKKVDPSFDDYLAMVNDRINRCHIQGPADGTA